MIAWNSLMASYGMHHFTLQEHIKNYTVLSLVGSNHHNWHEHYISKMCSNLPGANRLTHYSVMEPDNNSSKDLRLYLYCDQHLVINHHCPPQYVGKMLLSTHKEINQDNEFEDGIKDMSLWTSNGKKGSVKWRCEHAQSRGFLGNFVNLHNATS